MPNHNEMFVSLSPVKGGDFMALALLLPDLKWELISHKVCGEHEVYEFSAPFTPNRVAHAHIELSPYRESHQYSTQLISN